MIFNPEWTRKFPDPSENLVLKLQTAISPELLKSDKRFIARSKEDDQGTGSGLCAKTLHASCF